MTIAGTSHRTAGARRADRWSRRQQSEGGTATRSLPQSVLMVDDCRQEGDRLEAMLRSLGPHAMRIDRCDCGLSAVETLRHQRYDLVLISYRLPDMHGLELLSEIANLADDMAVILVGGRSGERVAADAIKSGAQDYLDRAELTPDVLREAVVSAMRTARLEWRTNCQIQQLRTARQAMQQRLQSVSRDMRSNFDQLQRSVAALKQSCYSTPLRQLVQQLDELSAGLQQTRRALDELALGSTQQG
jgi:DNA-binding NtrC family response regulator